jgi:hypothetical protein
MPNTVHTNRHILADGLPVLALGIAALLMLSKANVLRTGVRPRKLALSMPKKEAASAAAQYFDPVPNKCRFISAWLPFLYGD